MICFACQSDNREGVKFCEECGTEIALVCPRCDHRIPVGKKFCGECGQKLGRDEVPQPEAVIDYNRPDSYTPKFMAEKILTTRGSLEGERKLVTVFFSDVTGFTSLSEKLDPEAVHQIMDGCFKILMQEIHKYEGTINQFTGDGVMALFGAPLAHEDHAQRACHAALAIQKSLAEYGRKVQTEFGLDFKMRIGLNSGPVVVGAIGNDLRMDYTAVGDTTNLAARMESLAEPGGILISDSTYRLVKKYFEFESLGEVAVKGKQAPQAVYKLTRVSEIRSRLDASKSRGLIDYIGRKDEMLDLQKAYNKAQSGQGQVVGVVGEPGIGKSRFVFEMHRRADEPCRYIESRCLQYSSSIPFLPVLEIFRSYFDIGEGEAEEGINEKLKTKLADLDKDLIPSLPAFRHFLSLPAGEPQWERLEPKDKRIKTFEAIRNFFIRLSQDTPLIIVIDDLQWLDKTSEEFISYFIEWIANTQILLLLLYRPEYNHPWGSKSFYKQIGIYPLSDDESKQFIRRLLNDGEISQAIEQFIIGRTSGNPLFMEELLYTLIENRTVVKESGSYRIDETASQHQVPDTIQGIIAGRMDRLEDNIKTTLQMASVIGRSFVYKILRTLPGLSDALKTDLLRLQSLELIYEKRVFPELEYIFKNVITQEVAYNSLLFNRRKALHRSIGMAMEETYSNRLEEFYEIIAHHFSKSDHHERTFKYLMLSGDKAIRNNSAWEAFEFYKKAFIVLERYPEDAEQKKTKLKILHAMMSPMIMLNFPEESLGFLEAGAKLSKERDDHKSLIRFYSNMGFFHSVKGRHREGIRFSGKAFEEATAINDLTAMAQAAPDLCLSNFSTGRFKKVIEITSTIIHAIHKAEKEKDTFGGPAIVYAALYSLSGFSLAHLGRFDEGMSNCVYGLEAAMESENIFTISLCRYYAGMVLLMKGAWSEASDYLMSCLEGLERVDFVQIEALAKGGLGVAEAYIKDPIHGRALAEEGLRAFQEAGIKGQVATLQCYVGMCCHASGDYADARLLIDQSLASAIENNESYFKGRALIWQGRMMGKLSDNAPMEAVARIEEGLELLTELDTKPDMSMGHFFLGELYAQRNQEEAAKTHLKAAEASFKAMNMNYWIEETGKIMNHIE
ncbi:adenylate/guanylate cyclase domain-containing protein [Desulfosarcina sp.]|uniref:adenylate/guanylate cyclase domain-containing protein n=1 Tax=Desulfosarcina sp. TaxID=2027861 RepID=UPI0029BDCC00|nr:adenylate/guanylate cyclase domain-containing protein [Desulfosarcina sp.]MDX2451544.1 adenylate/guanylate cyclase domain-containing protein [Desulfosarcina sp.]